MQKIKRIWQSIDTLDDRIFFLTVIVSILISFIVFITDIMEGLSVGALSAVMVIMAMMLVLLYLGIRYPSRRNVLRFCLIVGLNFILFPVSFFYSGGIHSGMILFFLVGVFLVPVMLRGKASGFLFLVSLIYTIIVIEIAQRFPQIITPMSESQHYQDVKITFLISGFGLYLITVLILGAYNKERQKNEKLMESLRSLSIKDALSGLYNRRELYRRLEIMYRDQPLPERRNTLVRTGHYIAMFDIDNFKSINDTYGHGIGDQVLKEVSHVFNDMVHGQDGEMAARYGGEEFVCVIIADSLEEAYQRVDGARQRVAGLSFHRNRPPQVTISGGIISCMDGEDLTRAMSEVDKLLYQAKTSGKNRICRKED